MSNSQRAGDNSNNQTNKQSNNNIHEYLIRTGNDLKNGQKLRIFVTFFTTNQNTPFISKIFIYYSIKIVSK